MYILHLQLIINVSVYCKFITHLYRYVLTKSICSSCDAAHRLVYV